MDFSEIDKVLYPWAEARKLHIYTKANEEYEVRSMHVVSPSGDVCQIWLETVENSDKIIVGCMESKIKGRSMKYSTDIQKLETSLDQAYSQTQQWLGMK